MSAAAEQHVVFLPQSNTWKHSWKHTHTNPYLHPQPPGFPEGIWRSQTVWVQRRAPHSPAASCRRLTVCQIHYGPRGRGWEALGWRRQEGRIWNNCKRVWLRMMTGELPLVNKMVFCKLSLVLNHFIFVLCWDGVISDEEQCESNGVA